MWEYAVLIKLTCYYSFPVDMASSQHESSQNSLLRAQVESLKTQLASHHQELAVALHSRDQVKEKLGSAEAHVHHARQEILQLKAKVRNRLGAALCMWLHA